MLSAAMENAKTGSHWSRRSEAARAKTLAAMKRKRREDPEYSRKQAEHCSLWRQNNVEKCREIALKRRERTPRNVLLWTSAKHRARLIGVEFDLTPDDILVPENCPVLGFPLIVATGTVKPNSISLDRIDPSKGYVKGSVMVISHQANAMKSNATFEQVERLYLHMLLLRDRT